MQHKVSIMIVVISFATQAGQHQIPCSENLQIEPSFPSIPSSSPNQFYISELNLSSLRAQCENNQMTNGSNHFQIEMIYKNCISLTQLTVVTLPLQVLRTNIRYCIFLKVVQICLCLLVNQKAFIGSPRTNCLVMPHINDGKYDEIVSTPAFASQKNKVATSQN